MIRRILEGQSSFITDTKGYQDGNQISHTILYACILVFPLFYWLYVGQIEQNIRVRFNETHSHCIESLKPMLNTVHGKNQRQKAYPWKHCTHIKCSLYPSTKAIDSVINSGTDAVSSCFSKADAYKQIEQKWIQTLITVQYSSQYYHRHGLYML